MYSQHIAVVITVALLLLTDDLLYSLWHFYWNKLQIFLRKLRNELVIYTISSNIFSLLIL